MADGVGQEVTVPADVERRGVAAPSFFPYHVKSGVRLRDGSAVDIARGPHSPRLIPGLYKVAGVDL